MAKKETLVCKPCDIMVLVSDQGDAVIECYECGAEMVPKAAKKPAAEEGRAKRRPEEGRGEEAGRQEGRPEEKEVVPGQRAPAAPAAREGGGFRRRRPDPPRKDRDEHGRTVPAQVDRLGDHPALQPALHPLPLLLRDDLRPGRLHHGRGLRAARPDRGTLQAGGRALRRRAAAAPRRLRHRPARHRPRPAHVHGDQRHADRRRRLREDEGRPAAHGVALARRLDGGDPRRLPLDARRLRRHAARHLLPQEARHPLPDQLLVHQAQPGRHRERDAAGQVPRRHRLVHVHDRPHRPRRGHHERADLQGGLRGDPQVALRDGEGRARTARAADLRAALLPGRAADGQGRGGQVRAPLADLLHRRRQGLHRRAEHLPDRRLRRGQALLLLPGLGRQRQEDPVPRDLGEVARSSRSCATSRATRASAASASTSTSAAAAAPAPTP